MESSRDRPLTQIIEELESMIRDFVYRANEYEK